MFGQGDINSERRKRIQHISISRIQEIDPADIQHMAYLKAKFKQAGSDKYIVGPNAKKFDFLALFGLMRFR